MKTTTILTLFCFVLSPLFANDLDSKLQAVLARENIQAITFKRDTSSAMFKLGKMIFEDKRLSGNKNISCQDCHHPKLGTSDQLPLPIGEGGEGLGPKRQLVNGHIIPRNAPHLFNLGFPEMTVMFWDGRVSFDPKTKTFQTPEAGLNGVNPKRADFTKVLTSALSTQAMFPPLNHEEMRGQPGSNEVADAKNNFEAWALLTERFASDPKYQKLFFQAFPNLKTKDDILFAHLGEAMGHFQKHQFAVVDTPFDRYLKGNLKALTDKAKQGALIFYGKGQCVQCHGGIHMTDNKFHNLAWPQIGPGKNENRDDKGRFNITKKPEDLYAFKTPGLRNIALSGPFGHSGSLKTLQQVMVHYFRPMRSNHHYNPGFRNLPYTLDLQVDQMNERIRRTDPIVGFGLDLGNEDRDLLLHFLIQGLTDTTFKE